MLKIKVTQNGFSLIEITLVILMVGFAVLLVSNLPNSLRLVGDSRFTSTARDVASQKIEDTRSLGYDNIADGVTQINDTRLSSLPLGAGTLTIADCPATICKNGEQVKEVTAQVDWQENGNNKSLSLTTIVAEGGLR